MVSRLKFLDFRERFLPIKQAALLERMLADERLSARDREQLTLLADMVAARFHYEFRGKLEHLKAVYEPFDPDCETPALNPAARGQQRKELESALGQLLMDANFVEMSRAQIVACTEYQAQAGVVVKVNLSDYAQLHVFCRGMHRESRAIRMRLMPWRQKRQRVHVFSRVALLVQLAKTSEGAAYLKLFKNVVAEDLEMLLPYVRVRMRLFDHLKIGSSVAGGLATGAWKVFTATILSPWLLLLVMSGFAATASRGVFSFLSCKTKYMQALSSSLYFQNLANNTSALAHLVDAAEAEECKELLLAYYMLYLERERGLTQAQLNQRVEEWLRAEFGLDVAFEVSDAVEGLLEKELLDAQPPAPADSPPSDGVLRVCDLLTARRRLDAVWDAYFTCDDALTPAGVPAVGKDRQTPTPKPVAHKPQRIGLSGIGRRTPGGHAPLHPS